MSFKDEIIKAIKTETEINGSTESISIMGNDGVGWNRTSDNKMQRLETMVTGYANTIPNRMVNRGKPFDGTLIKEIREFIAPNIIDMEETYGLMSSDTFDVENSISNNKTFTITAINGNVITVAETVVNETPSSILLVTIDDPLYNLNVENTLGKIQANIFDYIPVEATVQVAGLVKQAASITKFDALTSNTVEQKFNELIDALRSSGAMSINES